MSKRIFNCILVAAVAAVLFFVCAAVYIVVVPPVDAGGILKTDAEGKAFSGEVFRVLTFYTGHAAQGAEATDDRDGGKKYGAATDVVLKNIRGISALSGGFSPDAVLLQDVDADSRRTGYLNQPSCYTEGSDYSSAFVCDTNLRSASIFPPYSKIKSGLLTLCENQIGKASETELPSPFSGLEAALNPHRRLLSVEIPVENSDKKIVLINFGIDKYASDEAKRLQTDAVASFARSEYEKGNYVIAGGSFERFLGYTDERYPILSDSEWKPGRMTVNELASDWMLVYDATVPTSRLLDRPYDTADENAQTFVTDGFILSPNLSVEMIVTVDQRFRYSSHNPVLLDVKLK